MWKTLSCNGSLTQISMDFSWAIHVEISKKRGDLEILSTSDMVLAWFFEWQSMAIHRMDHRKTIGKWWFNVNLWQSKKPIEAFPNLAFLQFESIPVRITVYEAQALGHRISSLLDGWETVAPNGSPSNREYIYICVCVYILIFIYIYMCVCIYPYMYILYRDYGYP